VALVTLATLAGAATVILWEPGPPSLSPAPIQPLELRPDDAADRVQSGIVSGSHVKVFLPTLPYLYTSHSINGALIKPSDNERGWEFDMAVDYRPINDTTHEFKLRKEVRFQDGTPFDADAVVLNLEYFKKAPVLYSKIHKAFDHAEKIDSHTVRLHLTEKYGSFLNDVIWMQFYTKHYLETNPGGWNGKANCPNLARPGPFGLGPYILTEGYIEGDRHTSKAVLKANPYYWDDRYPRVETITIYTELDSDEAKEMVLYEEGKLDITIVPPEDKVETILGPYSKLIVSESTDSVAIHMNLINGHPRLRDRVVRRALNEALHRQNLLHFVYEREGGLSPISPLLPGVREAVPRLLPMLVSQDPYEVETQARLRHTLDGLRLKVLTQDRFLALWRGIETQLNRVGVVLDIEVKPSEKEIFDPLLKTNAGMNEEKWDLLVWGNDDWYFNHPYTALLVYNTRNMWSTVYPDPVMDGYIDELFRTGVTEAAFPGICEKILRRAYEESYMLFVPTPNKVFAVNKEVVFKPYKMACIPLWKIQVTDQHWSLRPGSTPYPEAARAPVRITRFGQE
jgi:peptide/nickel transport system substrate-binding protein